MLRLGRVARLTAGRGARRHVTPLLLLILIALWLFRGAIIDRAYGILFAIARGAVVAELGGAAVRSVSNTEGPPAEATAARPPPAAWHQLASTRSVHGPAPPSSSPSESRLRLAGTPTLDSPPTARPASGHPKNNGCVPPCPSQLSRRPTVISPPSSEPPLGPARTALPNRLPGTLTVGSHQLSYVQPGLSASKDIWVTNVYSYAPGGGGPGGGLANDLLRVGGWGDTYYALLQFDLGDLPKVARSAILRLYDGDANGGMPTAVTLYRVTSPWDWRTSGTGSDKQRLWWADQPGAVPWGASPLPAPRMNSHYDIDVTSLYNAWQSDAVPNYGLELRPVSTSNNFDEFKSSRAPDPDERPELFVIARNSPGP